MLAGDLLAIPAEATVSKNINVNPGQYKVRGRERQGEDTLHTQARKTLTQSRKERGGKGKNKKKR
jgi:hypothetical protein